MLCNNLSTHEIKIDCHSRIGIMESSLIACLLYLISEFRIHYSRHISNRYTRNSFNNRWTNNTTVGRKIESISESITKRKWNWRCQRQRRPHKGSFIESETTILLWSLLSLLSQARQVTQHFNQLSTMKKYQLGNRQ